MKILITGANGQLGTDLVQSLSKKHEVVGTKRQELNIINNQEVLEYFKSHSFDIVINAVAYTNVDLCETDFDNAFLVNAVGPRNLAVASNQYNFKLIHISTDYVFSGENPNGYFEFDRTSPINNYGLTKLCGEDYIKNLCSKYFIIRTSWLYGKHGKNFVKTMLSLSEDRDELKVVNDQVGSPTFTVDLVDFISNIISSEKYGLYHFSNSGTCTWNEFAKEIFKISEKDITVLPISTEEFNAPASRPKFSVMRNYLAKLEFDYEPRHWKKALKEYILGDREQVTGDR